MFVFDNIQFAGTVLIRELIESQNYESSGETDGWAFYADGSAFVNTIRAYVFKTGEPPSQRIEMDTTGLNFYVDDPSVNGITGPAQLYTVDPSFYIASLIGVGDTAIIKMTPGGATFPPVIELLNAGLVSDVMTPRWNFFATPVVGIVSAVPTLGATPVGVAFTAPPSGKVTYAITADQSVTVAGGYSVVYGEIRAGAVVGAGAVVSSGNTGLAQPRKLVGATVMRHDGGSIDFPVSGLTPDANYNASVWYYQTAGTGQLVTRGIIVKPQP